MNITQIKNFVSTEYSAATAEVHNFIAWLENKDNEVKSALASVSSAKPVLEKAGYIVTVQAPNA